jgi:GTP cyclohydrolase II
MTTSIRKQVQITIDEGNATFTTFDGLRDDKEHIALCFEGPSEVPLVRLHSECLTGDVFGSARCDCGPQMHEALAEISRVGGALLYLRQEGRGIGLVRKIDAYSLQDKGFDTFEANRMLGNQDDERDFAVAADMLEALGLTRIRLMTNNPEKVECLRAMGIDVVSVVPTKLHVTHQNKNYLIAKAVKAGHSLDVTRLRRPLVVATA